MIHWKIKKSCHLHFSLDASYGVEVYYAKCAFVVWLAAETYPISKYSLCGALGKSKLKADELRLCC